MIPKASLQLAWHTISGRIDRSQKLPSIAVSTLAIGCVIFAAPAAAAPAGNQTVGSQFCSSNLAQTVKNLFTIIQFGGPLIGGTLFVGGTVAIPVVRRADLKKEIKDIRTQALLWGVIVAPLSTAILRFLLNNVVVGGSSCGF